MTVLEDEFYAITLTLKPKLYNHTIEEQYDLAKPIITNLHYGQMTVVAELTKSFNVHFHIILKRDKSLRCIGPKGRPVSFERSLYDRFRNSDIIGYVNIKKCTDKSGWISYISKDIQTTKADMARRVVVIDELNEFEVFD